MFTKAPKKLAILILLALVACGRTEIIQNSPVPATTTQPSAETNTPATPYPYPALDTTLSVPVNSPSSAPSLTPLPSLAVVPTEQATPLQIEQLRMFDTHIGWAVSSDGKICRTIAGVRSWTNVSPPVPEGNFRYPVVFFVDANTAVAVFARSFLPDSDAVEVTTWRTTDAGQSWQSGEMISSDQSAMASIYIMMLDSEHGWMLGEGEAAMRTSSVHFFKTQEGGMRWEIVYDTINHLKDPNTLWMGNFYPYDEHFEFLSETTGFFSNGRLFVSQDGGKSWLNHPLAPPADLPDIDCHDDRSECKYLNTVSTPQFASTQDGVLMRRVYSNTEDASLVFLYNASTVHLPLPIAQYLYYTHDGGKSWVPQPSPVKIGTVHFLNAQTGWLLGKNDPDPSKPTQLYQTTNGGETWAPMDVDSPLLLGSEMQFMDEQTGFAFIPPSVSRYYQDFDDRFRTTAGNTYIFYTTDGGRTWEQIEPQLIP